MLLPCLSFLAASQPVKLIAALLLLAGAIFFFHFLSIKAKQGIRCLVKPAGWIFLAGTLLFYNGYYNPAAPTNPVTLVLRAAISSLEMFVSETHLDEIVLEKPGFLETPRGEWYLVVFFGLYVAALMITFWTIVDLVGRGLKGRYHLFWRRNTPAKRKSYIFIGINTPSITLATDILANQPGTVPADIIFLDAVTEKKRRRDVSFKAFFRGEIGGSAGKDKVLDRLGPGCLVLECRQPLQDNNAADLQSLCKSMGYSGLRPWLESANTDIFVLSDDGEDNFLKLTTLVSAGVQHPTIYCRCREDGLPAKYARSVSADNIKYISLASLSVQGLMWGENGQFQPVHFVDVATDADGRPQGYVTSEFNALILGFGLVGKEALGFLYEFGSFANGVGELSPSHIYVVDSQMGLLAGQFQTKHPGLTVCTPDNPGGRVILEGTGVRQDLFWTNLRNRIDKLNYIVVSSGDTSTNIQVGLDLLEYALANRQGGLRHFQILVWAPGYSQQEQELVSRFTEDQNYGDHLRLFGKDEEVWTYPIVTEADANRGAREFFAAYTKASGAEPETDGRHCWDIRHASLRAAFDRHDLALIEKISVQEMEDRHNYYHAHTKKALGGNDLGPAAASISEHFEGQHCSVPETAEEYGILERLAVGEHLRWVSSYEMLGYHACPPQSRRDYLKKQHESMIPYAALTEEVRHYDWITIKTTYLLDDKR